MGILEKIAEIEREIARTQKNKGSHKVLILNIANHTIHIRALVHFSLISHSATEYHLGLLKAKLAKYRSQLLEPSKSAGASKVPRTYRLLYGCHFYLFIIVLVAFKAYM